MKRLILGALTALASAGILTTVGVSGQGRVDSPGVMTPDGRRAGTRQLQGAEDAVGRAQPPGHLQRQRPAGHSDAAPRVARHAVPAERRGVQAARRAARPERGQRQQLRLLARTRRGVRGEVRHRRRRRVAAAALARAREGRQPRVLVRHRSAGRTDSGVDARGAGRGRAAPAGAGGPPPPVERRRSRLDHRSQQLRPLHQHRRAEFDHAEDLQLRQPHRAGAGLARVPERDDSRDARHPDGRPQERGRDDQELDGQLRLATGKATSSSSKPGTSSPSRSSTASRCRTRAC